MKKNKKKTASNARSKNLRQHTHAAGVTTDGRTDEERGRNSGTAAGVVAGQGGPGPGEPTGWIFHTRCCVCNGM